MGSCSIKNTAKKDQKIDNASYLDQTTKLNNIQKNSQNTVYQEPKNDKSKPKIVIINKDKEAETKPKIKLIQIQKRTIKIQISEVNEYSVICEDPKYLVDLQVNLSNVHSFTTQQELFQILPNSNTKWILILHSETAKQIIEQLKSQNVHSIFILSSDEENDLKWGYNYDIIQCISNEFAILQESILSIINETILLSKIQFISNFTNRTSQNQFFVYFNTLKQIKTSQQAVEDFQNHSKIYIQAKELNQDRQMIFYSQLINSINSVQCIDWLKKETFVKRMICEFQKNTIDNFKIRFFLEKLQNEIIGYKQENQQQILYAGALIPINDYQLWQINGEIYFYGFSFLHSSEQKIINTLKKAYWDTDSNIEVVAVIIELQVDQKCINKPIHLEFDNYLLGLHSIFKIENIINQFDPQIQISKIQVSQSNRQISLLKPRNKYSNEKFQLCELFSSFRMWKEVIELAEEFEDNNPFKNNFLSQAYFYQENYDNSLKYQQKCLEQKIIIYGDESLEISNSYLMMGNIYMKLSKFEESLKFLMMSIKINQSQNSQRLIAESNQMIGKNYFLSGKYPEALNYQNQALQILNGIQEESSVESIYQDLGNTMLKLENYQMAFEYFGRALEIINKSDNKFCWEIYNDLGVANKELGNYDESIQQFQHASEIIKNEQGEQSKQMACISENLGETYYQMGKYEEALQLFRKAQEIYQIIFGDLHQENFKLFSNIGQTQIKLQNYSEGEQYLMYSLEKIIQIFGQNSLEAANMFENLGQLYEAKGQFQNAIEQYNKSFLIKSSVYTDDDKQILQIRKKIELATENIKQ